MNSLSIDDLTIGYLLEHPPYPLPFPTVIEYHNYLIQLQERVDLSILARNNSINVLQDKHRGQGNVIFYTPWLSTIAQVEENLKDINLSIRRCHCFMKKIKQILNENAAVIRSHAQARACPHTK